MATMLLAGLQAYTEMRSETQFHSYFSEILTLGRTNTLFIIFVTTSECKNSLQISKIYHPTINH